MKRTIICASVWLLWGACVNAQTPQPFLMPAPGSPVSLPGANNVVAGDLDGDGDRDLVVTSGKAKNMTVLLNDGRGKFSPAKDSPLAVGFSPGEMALADLNEDGLLDLGVANHDTYAITVFIGDGKGAFKPAPKSPFLTSDGSRPHTHALAFADVNADKKLDILSVNNDDDNVSVLLGNGRADFARAAGSPFRVGRSPYPLTLGDLNGDGKLDLVTPNTGSGDLSILFGDGRGQFIPSPHTGMKVGDRPFFVALGDLNGDQRLDLAVAHDDTSQMTVWLNKGDRGFETAPASPLELDSRAGQVAITDMNQDSKMDLVVATNTSVTVMLGDGRGNFSPAPGSPFNAGKGTWRLTVADLNSDHKPDIACSNLESDTVTILLSNR